MNYLIMAYRETVANNPVEAEQFEDHPTAHDLPQRLGGQHGRRVRGERAGSGASAGAV